MSDSDLLSVDVASVPVQDDSREELMRQLFGLRDSHGGRMGVDAVDENGNPFELKSTTKNGVSTARDVGPHTTKKWRQRYWIFAKGRNLKTGFVIDETYFLHPDDMDGICRTLEARFAEDVSVWDKAKIQLAAIFAPSKVERLEYLVNRGLTLNNPKIPWDYVTSHGTKITKNHAATLRELVRQRPFKFTGI